MTMSPLYGWGLWGTCLQEIEQKEVDLVSVKTHVEIRGFVAQVSSSLTYLNNYKDPLQVRYKVPVDEGAAVYKFEAHLDGRTITAHCMEKKAAEKVYKDAVKAGQTAVLAREDSNSSDVLNLLLGNLPPGTQAELKLSLVMELKVQTDGGVSFVLPTFLKPRYSPANSPANSFHDTEEIAKGQNIMFVRKQYAYEVKARVVGAHRIAQITSHSELLSVDISEDALSAEVSQCRSSNYDRDWTMLIYYADPYKTHVLRETGDRSGVGLMKDDLLMVNLFPEVPASSFSNKNEVIFVVDRSGSMQGETMQSARATLLLFLKSLPVGCFFNIVSFGSSFSFLFPSGSEMYNEETLAKASALQQNMQADMGGTEIFQPFKAIYSQPPKAGYARQILLISDGSVWNVDQMTELVSRHAHESRVFAVGIGHGASTSLIRGVARAGKGRSEMVFQQDKIQHKVMGLVTSMLQDSVHNVRVSCEVEPTSRVRLVPKVPPIIFGGQHLILYARIPADTVVKSVNIQGSLSSKDLNFVVKDSDIKVVHDEEMSLHRLAARAQINQWQVDQEEDISDDMISLSLATGVISRLTALVGVDHEGNAVAREEKQDCMPHMMMKSRRCGGARLRPMFGSQPKSALFGCSQPESAQAYQLLSGGLHDCTVFGASLGSAEACRGSSKVSSDSVQEDVLCSTEVSADSAAPSPADGDPLMAIVSKQRFDGSWLLEDVAELCGVACAVLGERNPAKTEAAWATALALALLEKRHAEARDQWSLLATKARAFLSGCQEDAQALAEAARALLEARP
ncbi:von Willebrand factor A domain-containing protein 5A-like isoform X7 [Penaeus monodon]|uniref:von Willebrand factor A domain-containing protein 5A-like isoform X7 n=1 Tax=Penaeus monodon TaxID=6687 RepID=UPI0018A7646A|nr:von Willebrand factor A domain-containing protein 5A-like isoform X7 [Penaeus monodon]